MKKKFTTTITNSVEPAAPTHSWGRGAAGKGGKTTNAVITKTVKESDNNEYRARKFIN